MQDEQEQLPQDDKHAVSPSVRTQRIIDYLKDLWGSPHVPSSDDLKCITEFVVHLPEEYRSKALTALAEHFVNGMSLHMLDIMANYQQKAEQEGLSAEDTQRTFEDIFPRAFHAIETLRKQLSVQSLDSLAALCNITIALYSISRADTAEEAQTWLYELSEAYLSELQQEHMLVDAQHQERASRDPGQPSTFTDWPSYEHFQGYIESGADIVQATEHIEAVSSPNILLFSLKRKPAA